MGRLAILTSAAALAAVLALATATSAAPTPPSPNTPPAMPGGGSQLFPPGPSAPAGQPGVTLPPGPVVIYTMEQIAIPQFTPELRQALEPLHTMQQVEDALKVRSVSFMWRRAEVSSAGLDAGFARQLATMPPHEVFVVPQAQGGALVGSIVQQRPGTAGAASAPPPGATPKPSPPKKP